MKIQFLTRDRNAASAGHSRGGSTASVLAIITLLATVGLSSCVGLTSAGSGTPGSSTGVLSASSKSVSYGSVPVGHTKVQSITMTNTGTAPVNVSKATITGAGFTVVGGNPSMTIAVGASATMQIQMAPMTSGAATGGLSIVSDASNSPLDVALTGTGAQSNLDITPASINFGNVKIGQSTTQTVKLTNSGNADLTVNVAQVSGSGFGITGLTLPATIAAGKSVSFTAQFSPASAQGMTGTIKFTDSASNSPQTLDLAGTGMAANSTLTANPGSIAFGSVAVGNNNTQSITLSNTGTSSIAISNATASGTGFSMTAPSTTTLNAGKTATFTAKFAPGSTGSATGAITITSNATNPSMTIALSGTGTQPHLAANPSTVAFGNVQVGGSASVSVVLTNSGTGSVSISGGTASGAGYTISGLTAATLTAGQSTSFTAKYSPTIAGSATGSISIASDAPGSPLKIALSGSGTVLQAGLGVNPVSVAFGNVGVSTSSSHNVTVTNSGNAALNITSASASGAGFSLTGLGAQTINAGASVTFVAQFSPSSTGSASGSISISSNAPNSPATILLSGTGVQGQLTANPSSASFGTVVMGNNNSQTINLTNGGSAAISISEASATGPGFSITGLPSLPMTINAGSSKTFNAVFAPSSGGNVTGSITLISNAPNSPFVISLSGTGQAATHLLNANPTSLNFNSVNDGSSSSLNVTLTNSGNTNVTISTATASGAGFSSSGGAGTTLTPNQTATLNVTFAPSSAGAASGTVAVASDATNSPTITLTGTGVQISNHSVDLTWTASTSGGVIGYNIYRSTVSGGPYSIVDSTPVAADAYTDSTVQSSLTYFYVVRAINSGGTESSNSTEVQAMIP